MIKLQYLTIQRPGIDLAIEADTLAAALDFGDRLTDVIGRISDSSGAGFGARDMQWDFDTVAEAENAEKKIRNYCREMKVEVEE